MNRTRSYYLTQLANELRLTVPDDEATEMVTEIAGHINSSGTDPWDEFGSPTTLAAELVAHRNVGVGRRWKLAAIVGAAVLMLLVGIELISDSTIALDELGGPLIFTLFVGVLSTGYGGQMRDRLRENPLPTMAAVFVAIVAVSLIFTFMANQFEGAALEVPGGRTVGIALMIASAAALFRFFPPLRFSPDSGLKGGLFGWVRNR